MSDQQDPLIDDMAAVVMAIHQVNPSLHDAFLRILMRHKEVAEAARAVVRSRHDDLDTGSMNWVAVLDGHLQALARVLRMPTELPPLYAHYQREIAPSEGVLLRIIVHALQRFFIANSWREMVQRHEVLESAYMAWADWTAGHQPVSLPASMPVDETKQRQTVAEAREPLTPPGRHWGVIWVPPPGCPIWEAVEALLQQIRGTDRTARLQFNGTEVELRPDDTVEVATERWRHDRAEYQMRLGIKPW